MWNTFLSSLVGLVMVMFAGSAMALVLSDDPTVNVGSVDEIVDSIILENSGFTTEIMWANSVLGGTFYTNLLKSEDFEDNNHADWLSVDTFGTGYESNDLWAYSLQSDPSPEYYIIKTGEIKNKIYDADGSWTGVWDYQYTHYLFSNEYFMDFAVISLSEIAAPATIDIFKLSHIAELTPPFVPGEPSEPSNPVPEPATMLLFGTGLVGLVGSRLRKKKK